MERGAHALLYYRDSHLRISIYVYLCAQVCIIICISVRSPFYNKRARGGRVNTVIKHARPPIRYILKIHAGLRSHIDDNFISP